jgi:hypothetical protein
MRTARYPDVGFVSFGSKPSLGVDLEEFRMQGPLEKAESQFVDTYVDLRPFHDTNPKTVKDSVAKSLYKKGGVGIKRNISTDELCFLAYRTIMSQAPNTKRLTAANFFGKNLIRHRLLRQWAVLKKTVFIPVAITS